MKLKPCASCPFRTDVPAYLYAARGEEIWETLERGAMFPCHKTVDYDDPNDEEGEGKITGDSQFCAGAMILMEKEWEDQGGCMANQMVRILTRIGENPLNPDNLDMNAPVFDDTESWINYLAEGLPRTMTPKPQPVATLLNTVALALEQFDSARLHAPDAWRMTDHMAALSLTLHADLRQHLDAATLRLQAEAEEARRAAENGDTLSPSAPTPLQAALVPEVLSLAAYEKACLARALELHAGNVIPAAAALGIAKSTMYRKLKEHGLRD